MAQVAVDQDALTPVETLKADEFRKGEAIYDELVTYLEQSQLLSQVQSQTRGLYLFDNAMFWLAKAKKRLPSYTWAHRFLQKRHLKRRLFKENNDTIVFDEMIREGKVKNYAELAELGQVSRARITQIMSLLNLAPPLQRDILFRPPLLGALTDRDLRQLTNPLDWQTQEGMWAHLRPGECWRN